jgi:hypothetical protein
MKLKDGRTHVFRIMHSVFGFRAKDGMNRFLHPTDTACRRLSVPAHPRRLL